MSSTVPARSNTTVTFYVFVILTPSLFSEETISPHLHSRKGKKDEKEGGRGEEGEKILDRKF